MNQPFCMQGADAAESAGPQPSQPTGKGPEEAQAMAATGSASTSSFKRGEPRVCCSQREHYIITVLQPVILCLNSTRYLTNFEHLICISACGCNPSPQGLRPSLSDFMRTALSFELTAQDKTSIPLLLMLQWSQKCSKACQ